MTEPAGDKESMALEVLRQIEWSQHDDVSDSHCPSCSGQEPREWDDRDALLREMRSGPPFNEFSRGHKPGCSLSAALGVSGGGARHETLRLKTPISKDACYVRDRVLLYIASHPGTDEQELALALGVNDRLVSAACDQLRLEGLVGPL